MIIYTKGNIFETVADYIENPTNRIVAVADAIVNPVNCVGSLGSKVSQQFAEKYPELVAPYERVCREGKLKPGEIWLYTTNDAIDIINLATKDHWKDKSKLEWVDQGLMNLADLLEDQNYKVVAIPALGCGYGRLQWEDVKYLIQKRLEDLDCKIIVFEPNQPRTTKRRPDRRDKDYEWREHP